MSASAPAIRVEVVYALPGRQELIVLEVDAGTTVEQAIARSGIIDRFPEIDPARHATGIFGKRAPPQTVLKDGDRVEIYRPLVADPKSARRRRAKTPPTQD